jgi:RNA polymerase sigma-70 factor (ECF subfamily)
VLLDRGQAEEVTQEVFLHIWRSAGPFDPGKGSAAPWIWWSTHSRAVDCVRPEQSVRTNDSRYAPQHFEPDVDSVVEMVPRDQGALSLHRSLECLTTPQRQALSLIYFAGYSNLQASLRDTASHPEKSGPGCSTRTTTHAPPRRPGTGGPRHRTGRQDR